MGLTAKAIENRKPKQRQYTITDQRVGRGGTLQLLISPGGTKSFYLLYRIDGRKRRIKIGNFPDLSLAEARTKAGEYMNQVAHGVDPAQVKQVRREALTFGQLSEVYLRKHARSRKKASSARKDEQYIDRFLLPAWGKLKVRNLRRSDITDVLDKILEKNQFVQANRVRALISKMLNFAIEEEMIEEGFANPAAHLPRRPSETPRDRYLTGDEIRRLWELLPQSPMGAIYRMILVTGQRPGEVKSMKWADIKDDIWTVPAALAKNGRANPVPLSTLARNILESLKPESSEFVFVSPRGGHLRWFSRATRQLNEACGFRGVGERRGPGGGRSPATGVDPSPGPAAHLSAGPAAAGRTGALCLVDAHSVYSGPLPRCGRCSRGDPRHPD